MTEVKTNPMLEYSPAAYERHQELKELKKCKTIDYPKHLKIQARDNTISEGGKKEILKTNSVSYTTAISPFTAATRRKKAAILFSDKKNLWNFSQLNDDCSSDVKDLKLIEQELEIQRKKLALLEADQKNDIKAIQQYEKEKIAKPMKDALELEQMDEKDVKIYLYYEDKKKQENMKRQIELEERQKILGNLREKIRIYEEILEQSSRKRRFVSKDYEKVLKAQVDAVKKMKTDDWGDFYQENDNSTDNVQSENNTSNSSGELGENAADAAPEDDEEKPTIHDFENFVGRKPAHQEQEYLRLKVALNTMRSKIGRKKHENYKPRKYDEVLKMFPTLNAEDPRTLRLTAKIFANPGEINDIMEEERLRRKNELKDKKELLEKKEKEKFDLEFKRKFNTISEQMMDSQKRLDALSS